MKLPKLRFKYTILLGLWLGFLSAQSPVLKESPNLMLGADRPGAYLPLLYGKSVGVLVNHSSLMADGKHLVDFLLENNVAVKVIYSPEHGFRGNASAGEKVKNGKDPQTGLPVISLYGNHKKPKPEDLKGIDIVVFDIQDVGARFFTYISSMSYMMEAIAEQQLKMLILDRPNPHGYYIDGPVLEMAHTSFVGMHAVPIIHGMTVGEYAQMVNGEGWLKGGINCDLEVVACSSYDHNTAYVLPVKPSPNLPNQVAINLYPSLCFFEGTVVSVGRGTEFPFQLMGAPWLSEGDYNFTPQERAGAKNPPLKGQNCKGFLLKDFAESYMDGLGELYLFWLTESYKMAPQKDQFFTPYFTLLAGTKKLQQQIEQGQEPQEIRASWQSDLDGFQQIRRKYLLYPDFHS
jgi:uncharacterized protein YbbC (DUF1343 family)